MTITIINASPRPVIVGQREQLVIRPLYGAGAKGETGPQGPQGPSGEGAYEHVQNSPVSSATINHNLGRRVQVEVFTLGGIKMGCAVQQLNDNQVQLDFNSPQAFIAVVI